MDDSATPSPVAMRRHRRIGQADALRLDLAHSQRRVRQLTAELALANRTKNQFLANMSHEIRTPMNGIVGVCELLSETPLSAKQSEYLQIIRNSSQSLLRLLNDILDFAKIEAGKLVFETIPFSLSHLLHEVTDLFIEEVSRKDIELVVDLPPEVPDHLRGDPLRLRQVVINLLSNAIKFTDRGEIVLSVRRAHFRGRKNVRLEFSVRDTGIGISEQIQDQLFNAFIQADGSTTRKYGGTGLGLAICRRIVELMGGQIRVTSQPGQGSTFVFDASLGLASGSESPTPLLPVAMRDLRVVVAENQPSARQVLMRELKRLGLRSEAVTTRAALLQRCSSMVDAAHVDLVLVSSQFEGVDPVRGVTALLHAMRGAAPRTILLCRSSRESERQRSIGSGQAGILLKPIRFAALRDTIIALFQDQPPLRTSVSDLEPGWRQPAPGAASLQRLPGLDVARGFKRSGGCWRMYLDGLSACCGAYRSFVDQVQELLDHNDFSTACQRAQDLKDDAARISANRLYAAARALQVSCARHDRPRIAAELRRVHTGLGQLEAAIKQLGFDTPEITAIPVDHATSFSPELIEALHELDQSLQELDPVRSDHCLQWMKAGINSHGIGISLGELERQIQRYDFESARQTLQRLIPPL